MASRKRKRCLATGNRSIERLIRSGEEDLEDEGLEAGANLESRVMNDLGKPFEEYVGGGASQARGRTVGRSVRVSGGSTKVFGFFLRVSDSGSESGYLKGRELFSGGETCRYEGPVIMG